MRNFIFQNATTVYFGQGCVKEYLASFVEEHGPNVLLAYGGGSVKRSGLYDEVFRILRRAGKQVVDLPDILPGPTYEKALGLPASLEGVEDAALERLKERAAACSLPPQCGFPLEPGELPEIFLACCAASPGLSGAGAPQISA